MDSTAKLARMTCFSVVGFIVGIYLGFPARDAFLDMKRASFGFIENERVFEEEKTLPIPLVCGLAGAVLAAFASGYFSSGLVRAGAIGLLCGLIAVLPTAFIYANVMSRDAGIFREKAHAYHLDRAMKKGLAVGPALGLVAGLLIGGARALVRLRANQVG